MISISRLLSSDTDSEQSRMAPVRFLIRGIGLHSIEGDPEDRKRFREMMYQLSELIADDISPDDLMAQAGVVLDSLGDHNRCAVEQLHAQAAELQNVVKMLIGTFRQICGGNAAIIAEMGEIEEEVARIRGLDEIHTMNARLATCLGEIRRETEGRQEETKVTIENLNQGLEEALQRSNDGNGTDTVTGLPMRPEAELALAQSGRGGERVYAAMVVLDRLQAANLRFGTTISDSVLSGFVQSLQQELPTADRLFRWSGTSVLALLLRDTGLETVRGEIARIMEAKLDHVVQTASRTILLPLAARWTVFPISAAPRLIYRKLDAFAALPAAEY